MHGKLYMLLQLSASDLGLLQDIARFIASRSLGRKKPSRDVRFYTVGHNNKQPGPGSGAANFEATE